MNILDGFEVTDPHHGGKIGVRWEQRANNFHADWDDIRLQWVINRPVFFIDKEKKDYAEGVELSHTDAYKLYLTLKAFFELTDAL